MPSFPIFFSFLKIQLQLRPDRTHTISLIYAMKQSLRQKDVLCDLEIFYQVVKATDFLPRESVLNSRELAFSRGIESVFCESICVHISVYVYVLTSRPYMDPCSWSQEKKKSKRNRAAPLIMLPQMACPSMWIRAAEHTLCSRVLHAGHPALQCPVLPD